MRFGILLRKMRGRLKMTDAIKDEKTNLAPPWTSYAGRVMRLFEHDDAVHVEYDQAELRVTLRVDGALKAEALAALMPSQVVYGNVVLKVDVVPSNEEPSAAETFRAAFAGNQILADVAEGFGPAGDISYALFVPNVVQIREDDISEFEGLTTMTCAQLAKSVLEDGHLFISSAPRE